MTEPEYLGDAVYASHDGFYLTLTTDSHKTEDAGNVILLEPSVISCLLKYLEKVKQG